MNLIFGLMLTAAAWGAERDDAGRLRIMDRNGERGECPLKRTEVKAQISGYVGRVQVTQIFENPLSEKIEAVYVFPLPNKAAVDGMTMLVGERVVQGKIKPREEAQAIFDAARAAGRTASLLEQERPNVFTQSVTNIGPGQQVKVTLTYVETLAYEAGKYQFVFPMVVGPRYIPRGKVGDAGRITPPVAGPGMRAGHDVSLEVALDAGVPLDGLVSKSHEVVSERVDARRANVRLKNLTAIPNRDFVLEYDVAGRKVEDAVLAHKGAKGGYFALILQPPDRVPAAEVTPRELVFVVDTSGSMMGFPLEKSKEVMRMALGNLHARDTFNVITFAGDTHVLFPQPVAATEENVAKAREFMEGRRGGGGTEMMKAIRTALAPTLSQEHLRVVAFLTDGYVGNDMEIIAEVKKYRNARVFSFGIGSSVNRFLLDKMAEFGRGEVEYVSLKDDGSAAAKRFYERMRDPLWTDLQVEWNGLGVTEVYPKTVPDLFAAKPVVLQGRYEKGMKGVLRITGKQAGKVVTRTVAVDLPGVEGRNEALGSLWARTKIEDLMSRDYAGVQRGTLAPELRAEITKLGLEHKLMTQFTAFVAVEEKTVLEGGVPKRVEVVVEMPEGVSHEGVYGKEAPMPAAMALRRNMGSGTPGFVGGQVVATAPLGGRMQMEERVADRKATAGTVKLHPDLAGSVKPGLVKNGKVEVKVYAAGKGLVEALKRLGVEVMREDAAGGYVACRVAVGQLGVVAQMAEVRYVAPLN